MNSRHIFSIILLFILPSCSDQGPGEAEMIDIISKYMNETRTKESYHINRITNIACSEREKENDTQCSFSIDIINKKENTVITTREWISVSREKPRSVTSSIFMMNFEGYIYGRRLLENNIIFSDIIFNKIELGGKCFDTCSYLLNITDKTSKAKAYTHITTNNKWDNGQWVLTPTPPKLGNSTWQNEELVLRFQNGESLKVSKRDSVSEVPFDITLKNSGTFIINSSSTGGLFTGGNSTWPGPKTECRYEISFTLRLRISNCEYRALNGIYYRN